MRDLNLISLTGEVLADVEVRRLSDGSPYGETVLGWGEDQQVEVLLLGDRYTPHGRWRQGWRGRGPHWARWTTPTMSSWHTSRREPSQTSGK